jgi:hypothetical protein
MRPLRAVASIGFLGLLIACSNKQSDAPGADQAKPEGAVAIILQSIGDLPKLEMRVAFAPGVDPGPHIEPLAGAIVEARKVCFAKPVADGLVAAFHVDIKGGLLAARSTNEQGKCLAEAIDKKPVTDKVDASVDLQVRVAK